MTNSCFTYLETLTSLQTNYFLLHYSFLKTYTQIAWLWILSFPQPLSKLKTLLKITVVNPDSQDNHQRNTAAIEPRAVTELLLLREDFIPYTVFI